MPAKTIRPSTPAVVLSTVFFVLAMLALGGLATNVIVTMRSSADLRDDERAVRAAEAALQSLKDRILSTVQDNAQWDDAFEASQSDNLAAWAWENWGSVSKDYPLYDGVIVTAADGRTVSATLKGEDLDPKSRFDSGFLLQLRQAATLSNGAVVNFVRTPHGVSLLASQALQPHSRPSDAKAHSILSFFRDVSDSDLSGLEKEYQLQGLRLFLDGRPEHLLSIPLKNIGGEIVGYLGWKSLKAGTHVYEEVRGQVTAAVAILAIFVAAVVLAGGAESRRLAKLAAQARHEASHDSLSGLLNRSGLLAAMRTEQADKGDFVLHLLDLDGFKGVNDAWGHQIGDGLIRKIAEALPDCHPEVLHAARLGGDEFALVQRGTADYATFSSAVLSIFGGVFEVEGRTVEVGASMGGASSEALSDPFETLRRADLALYRAKDDGKGRAVLYHPGLDDEREQLALLEDDLRSALADGAIGVVYQPLVSAQTGRLNGVEALARWQTERGPVSPEVFISLAERSGLIDVLGMHVLRQSVRNALGWPGLKLSVNVSPIQLCNPSFASSVTRLLKEEGFDAERLILEITEGVLMSNPDQAQRAIEDLRKSGVRFSLDDFGIGYASIGALRQFGFDSMKIDRSLVWAADGSDRGQEVLKATIALATALSIPVTAEGIETETQAQLLREAGCDQLQGYMVGRPMPADEITRIAAEEIAFAA